MKETLTKLDGLVVKQAVRDVASKDPKISKEALSYFLSKEFSDLCERNMIDKEPIIESISEVYNYPIVSRKRLANSIARVIDSSFASGILSK